MLQMSMSKLSLKVLLGVFALMFSANESHSFPIECTNVDPTPLYSTFSSPSAAESWLPNKVVLKESSIKYFNTHKKRSSKENSWTVFFRSTKVVAKYMPVNKKLRVQLVFQAAYKQVAPVYYNKCVDKSHSEKNTTSDSNTSKASNQNKLKSTFMKKTSTDRRNIQSALFKLGLYTSTIDGLYGKGTEAALKAYNKKYLDASDLKLLQNVEKLLTAVLTIKQSSEPDETKIEKPKTDTDTDTKVETKPKRQLEKEFGISFYGSFLHTERVPYALFFLNEIEAYDRFEFRKALRNHNVSLIVLSSPGGSVWEGLSMAGIIYDKRLNTYIPKISVTGAGDCASACSFMYFAGDKREVEGKLGVHQFYSEKGSKKEKVEAVQEGTQFTVSEIIGFLNEFGTPSWVFERMFQQSEMYYFKEKELEKLETEVNDELRVQFKDAQKFIIDLSSALQELSN